MGSSQTKKKDIFSELSEFVPQKPNSVKFSGIRKENWKDYCRKVENQSVEIQLAILHRAMELDPLNPIVYCSICEIVSKTVNGEIQANTNVFILMILLGMQRCKFHENLFKAMLLLFKARFKEAKIHIEKEIENFPDFFFPYYTKSQIYLTEYADLISKSIRSGQGVGGNRKILEENKNIGLDCLLKAASFPDTFFVGSSINYQLALAFYNDEDYNNCLRLLMKDLGITNLNQLIKASRIEKENFDIKRHSQKSDNTGNRITGDRSVFCIENFIPFKLRELRISLCLERLSKEELGNQFMQMEINNCHEKSDYKLLFILNLQRFVVKEKYPKKEILEAVLKYEKCFPNDTDFRRIKLKLLVGENRIEEAMETLKEILLLSEEDKKLSYDYFLMSQLLLEKKEKDVRLYYEAEKNLRLAILLALNPINEGMYKDVLHKIERIEESEYPKNKRFGVEMSFDTFSQHSKSERLAFLQLKLDEDSTDDDLYFLIFLEFLRYSSVHIELYLRKACKLGKKKEFWRCLTSTSLESTQILLDYSKKMYPDWICISLFECFYVTQENAIKASRNKQKGRTKKKIKPRSKYEKDRIFAVYMNRCYRMLKDNPENKKFIPFVYYMMIGNHMDNNRYEKSLEVVQEYHQITKKSSRKRVGITLLESSILQKQEKFLEAKNVLLKTIKELEDQPDTKNNDLAQLYLALSNCFRDEEDEEKVLKFTKIAKTSPFCVIAAHRAQFKYYLRIGKLKKALENINHVISNKFDPKDYLKRAKLHYLRNNFSECEKDLRVFFIRNSNPKRHKEGLQYFKRVAISLKEHFRNLDEPSSSDSIHFENIIIKTQH